MSSNEIQHPWYFYEPVPTLVPWRTPLTAALRCKFFITGVVFPLVCFGFVAFFAGGTIFSGLWQSGETRIYIDLLLANPSFLYFLPLLSFSIICLAVWCLQPAYATNLVVRYGIYAGVLLSFLFFVLLFWITLFASLIFASIAAILLAVLVQVIKLVLPKSQQFTIRQLLVTTTIAAATVALLTNVEAISGMFFGLLSFSCLIMIGSCVPLSMVTFLRVSVAATYINSAKAKPTNYWLAGFFTFTWLAGFAATWKFAIESVIREYEKLPAQPPQGCYVSCAAAHGHPRFVGTTNANNATRPVNMQMRRLKMLEFALQILAPVLHQNIRKIYNWIGPKLASVCQKNRWFADVTYVALKPLEASAIALQIVLGIGENHVQSIYASRETRNS